MQSVAIRNCRISNNVMLAKSGTEDMCVQCSAFPVDWRQCKMNSFSKVPSI